MPGVTREPLINVLTQWMISLPAGEEGEHEVHDESETHD